MAEFVGAQPPAAVNRFLDSLLPSEADLLVAQGDEDSLRRAVELEPTRADAAVPLARILLGRDDTDGALAILEACPAALPPTGSRPGSSSSGASRRLDLADAFAALDEGDHERGLDLLSAPCRAPTAPRTTSAASWSGSSTSSASTANWLASRAVGWPAPSTR